MSGHLCIENKPKWHDVCSHADKYEEAWKTEDLRMESRVMKDHKRYYSSLTVVQGARISRPHLACVLKQQKSLQFTLDRLFQCSAILKVKLCKYLT